jgi:hypothetical protein
MGVRNFFLDLSPMGIGLIFLHAFSVFKMSKLSTKHVSAYPILLEAQLH